MHTPPHTKTLSSSAPRTFGISSRSASRGSRPSVQGMPKRLCLTPYSRFSNLGRHPTPTFSPSQPYPYNCFRAARFLQCKQIWAPIFYHGLIDFIAVKHVVCSMDELRAQLRNADSNIKEWERYADGDGLSVSCSSISSLKGGTSGLGDTSSGYIRPRHKKAGSLVLPPDNDVHTVTFSTSGPVHVEPAVHLDVASLAYTQVVGATVNSRTSDHGYNYDNPQRPTVTGAEADLPYYDANEEADTCRVDMEHFYLASAEPLSSDGSGFMQENTAAGGGGGGPRSSISGGSSTANLLRR